MFDSEEHLIRIDMSEFMEKHSVSAADRRAARDTWATKRAATLTEAVRRKPYSA